MQGKISKDGTGEITKLFKGTSDGVTINFGETLTGITRLNYAIGSLNVDVGFLYDLQKDFGFCMLRHQNIENITIQCCTLNGIKSIILRSDRTCHPKNIVEILSEIHFKNSLDLSIGDSVEIEILSKEDWGKL